MSALIVTYVYVGSTLGSIFDRRVVLLCERPRELSQVWEGYSIVIVHNSTSYVEHGRIGNPFVFKVIHLAEWTKRSAHARMIEHVLKSDNDLGHFRNLFEGLAADAPSEVDTNERPDHMMKAYSIAKIETGDP